MYENGKIVISELDLFIYNIVNKENHNIDVDKLNRITSEKKLLFGLLKKLAANKFSIVVLEKYINFSNIQGEIRDYLLYQKKKDSIYTQTWKNNFHFISRLFDKYNIDYVFIKILDRVPNIILGDIDVLPYDYINLWKALVSLHLKGYTIYKLNIFFDHPLKLGAARYDIEPIIPVDFYPDLFVNRRKIIGDKNTIFKRRIRVKYNGIDFYAPSYEDSVYIVGVHAYSHLRITLAELIYGLNVIKKERINFEYIYDVADSFGTLDAIYLYFNLINSLSISIYNELLVEESYLEKYEKSFVSLRIKKWLNNFKKIYFPLEIPKILGCVHSGIYHSRTVWNRLEPITYFFDITSHILAFIGD